MSRNHRKDKEKEKEELSKILPKYINFREYELSKTIGIGSHSIVKLAKTAQSNRFFAVKKIKKVEMIKLGIIERAWHEIKSLSLAENAFVVKFQGFGMDDKFIYIVTELINGGNFYDLLRKEVKFPLPQAT